MDPPDDDPEDFRQVVYVGGPCVSVCSCRRAYNRWSEQRRCEGAVKDHHRDSCYWVTSDGTCLKDIDTTDSAPPVIGTAPRQRG